MDRKYLLKFCSNEGSRKPRRSLGYWKFPTTKQLSDLICEQYSAPKRTLFEPPYTEAKMGNKF